MPRSVPDKGIKPFELRTGIGGLPPLGGMYRAGDPAVIPPHKFHLLVNMRVQPQGLVTRPGLVLEFDTGVEECIDGITETQESGSTLLLWPGAAAEGGGARNAATFRVVYAYQSSTYSEFMFVLSDSPAASEGTLSPVVQPPYLQDDPNLDPIQEPFFFRSELCVILLVTHPVDGPRLAILSISLPQRNKQQANDCLRNTTPNTAPCVDQLGLWPYTVPSGTTGILAWIDCPLATWQPESWVVAQERNDNPLDGTPAINEVLYLLVLGTGADAGKRRLLKYDGVTWTTEFSPPDDLLDNVALGWQNYGPYLVASGTSDDWSAYRKDDGTWATIAGLGGPPIDPTWTLGNMLKRGITYKGAPGIVVSAIYQISVTTFDAIHVLSQDTTDVNTNALTVFRLEDGSGIHIWDWAQAGGLVYVIGDYHSYTSLFCSDDPDTEHPIGLKSSGSEAIVWIQEVGGRVYVGGKIQQRDPVTQADDAGVIRHGVYDVTDPTNIQMIYEVLDTEQTDDTEAERYSRGCLPTFPEALEAE